jgi:hypothetical protein
MSGEGWKCHRLYQVSLIAIAGDLTPSDTKRYICLDKCILNPW